MHAMWKRTPEENWSTKNKAGNKKLVSRLVVVSPVLFWNFCLTVNIWTLSMRASVEPGPLACIVQGWPVARQGRRILLAISFTSWSRSQAGGIDPGFVFRSSRTRDDSSGPYSEEAAWPWLIAGPNGVAVPMCASSKSMSSFLLSADFPKKFFVAMFKCRQPIS